MKYCISDIHGCSKTLIALLDKINFNSNDTVYFLGDYVDRGPDSKGVLDILMSLPNAVCHKGNHEDMMIKALAGDDYWMDNWVMNGALATYESFNKVVDTKYINFIENMKLVTELDNFYLCHANLSKHLLDTPEQFILWDRDYKITTEELGGKQLICGHTPTDLNVIASSLQNHKIIIDNGCIYTSHKRLGNLTALCLDDMQLFVQENIDIN